MKKKKIALAVLLGCSLLLQHAGGFGIQTNRAEAAEQTMTMSQYFDEVMGQGKTGKYVAKQVTVSSWDDFKKLRDCMTVKRATQGVTFTQTEDIQAGNVSFSYEEAYDRFSISQKGKCIGAVGRNKKVYETLTGNTTTDFDSIGLSDACLENGSGNHAFYGKYDGKGHALSGIILERSNYVTAMDSALFGQMDSSARVQNLTIKNSCMIYAYATIAAYSSGTIQNCSVEDTIGFGPAYGGVTGINDGSITNCKVSGCTFMTGSYSIGEADGALGGISATMVLGTVRDSSVRDTTLRSFGKTTTSIGGITGKQESNTPYDGGIICSNCVSDAKLVGGYCMGGICGSMEEDKNVVYTNAGYLEKCRFEGSILEQDEPVTYIGGIIGRVKKDNEIYVMECVNQGTIERTGSAAAYTGAIGGILGEATEDAVLFLCTNKGTIKESETAIAEGIKYIGGIAGEANGQLRIVNCSNRAAIQMSTQAKETVVGGLVGKMSQYTKQYVANSSNCGALSGYQVAGLVGVLAENTTAGKLSAKKMAVENCASLGQLRGSKKAGLVLTAEAGHFLRCYTAFDGDLAAVTYSASAFQECFAVNDQQIKGAQDASAISNVSGSVAATNSVAAALTNGSENMTKLTEYGYSERYDYAEWKNDETGYPSVKFTRAYSYPALTTIDAGAAASFGRLDDTSDNNDDDDVVDVTPKPTQTPKATETPKPTEAPKPTQASKPTEAPRPTISVKPLETPKPTQNGQKKVQLKQPKIALTKGKLSGGVKYMQISLKKTYGKYIEVYLQKQGGSFFKVKLKSSRIAYFGKKIRFSYQKGNQVYACKVRTYQYQQGKKVYSPFSKTHKIRL